MDITDIQIIPSPSGCNHVTLRCQIDGKPFEKSLMRSDLQINNSGEVEVAIIGRICSYIKETGITDPAQIRTALRSQVFKI